MIDLALLLVGGLLLYVGAEWLVSGASSVASALRVPPLIIGLTVVAYGTSMPEAIVGVQASLAGSGALTIGNVVGSNIANFGLVLGLTTLLRPTPIEPSLRARELPVLMICSLSLILVLLNHRVGRSESAILLISAVAYSLWMIRGASQSEADNDAPPVKRRRVAWFLARAVAGLVVLLLGGHLLVRGASSLAVALGVSERIIGLTVVAIGTSLPELVTSVVASLRGRSAIAVGNLVGSNIFNILFCLGTAGVIRPISLQTTPAWDLAVMMALTVLAGVFMRKERVMRRWEGGLLLAGYVGYLVSLVFVRST